MKLGFQEWLVLITSICLGVIDLFLYWIKGNMTTIIDHFAFWSQRFPLLPFLVGLLAGHLFWPNHGYCE